MEEKRAVIIAAVVMMICLTIFIAKEVRGMYIDRTNQLARDENEILRHPDVVGTADQVYTSGVHTDSELMVSS